MNDTQTPNNLQSLFDSIRRLVSLHIDYARLTAAEKITVLLSTIAFSALVVIFGTLVLIFLSIGVGHMLSETVAHIWAYLIVAGFYLVLFILLFVFRKKLFVNPTARFISRLFCKEPENPEI